VDTQVLKVNDRVWPDPVIPRIDAASPNEAVAPTSNLHAALSGRPTLVLVCYKKGEPSSWRWAIANSE